MYVFIRNYYKSLKVEVRGGKVFVCFALLCSAFTCASVLFSFCSAHIVFYHHVSSLSFLFVLCLYKTML